MKRILFAATATLVVLAASALSAAEDKNGDREKQEILKLVSSYQAAFNRGDAKGIAALYTPDGDHIGPQGERIEGRAELEKQFADFLSTRKQLKLAVSVTALRMVGGELAVVDMIPKVVPALQAMPAEPRSVLVLVKRDGNWLIESARDTLAYAPANVSHLKEIEWLIGDWSGDAASPGATTVRSTCDWTANKSFLIRKFDASLRNGAAGAGTEVIGWDPREHKIRSWDFDSNGAFGESTWTRDGDGWIIKRTGVLPDGGRVSATYILTRLDENTLAVQSRDCLQDGEKQPDAPAVKVRRQLPPAESGVLPAPPAGSPRKATAR